MIRRRAARWAALAALVVCGALVALLATRPPVGAVEAGSPLLGHRAPEIAGTTIAGQPFDLHALERSGRWVLVTFFASWCPPCQDEEPELVAFAYQHRGDVAVVGVVYNDSATAAQRFLSRSGATWPALADGSGSVAYDYGVSAPPEAFLVAPDGTVEAHTISPVTAAGLDRLLAQAGIGGGR